MEALFIFIVKSSSLIALFYFAYFFLLRKETFFNSSRWFLLAGLVTSVVLPLVVYTKVVWIDPVPVPVSYTPAANFQYVSNFHPQIAEKESFEINWNLVSLVIYGIGFAAFMIKFGIDFYSLNSVLKGRKIEQQADFKFVDVNENIAPFSYFDYIVYNSSMYSEKELESILEHEKVHSDQHHTVDVIISRIFCILFWFNPIIWLYKKVILQNLEFIADSEAAKKISDKKAYQYTLLKITTHETCVAITNHFYQSLIKKRIVMLNKNQSKKWNYWKYYAVLPVLALFVLSFQIKTIAQEKKELREKAALTSKNQDPEVIKITKSTTDQELKDLTAKLKTDHNINLEISNIKRNKNNELTSIKIRVVKENGKVQIIEMNSTEALKDCSVVINTDENGSKSVSLVTADQIEHPIVIKREVAVRDTNDSDNENDDDAIAPIAPIAPAAPAFPAGLIPPSPVDMSKMPKAPIAPKNINDKAAWSKFEKDMAEFEKKMKVIEPQLTAYGDQIEAIMAEREAIYEKQMAKYEVAMQKFNSDMEKYSRDVEIRYGLDSKDYEKSMKQYEKDMKQYELDMKQHEKDMKQHAKDMKQHEKDMKEWEKENRKS
ncbi:M56 family metallopeptidase [Flavobacterium johnsoniae]|uniref:Peptidase family M56, BlaR1 n=1 Tax=Flavobacterium johnsoniae (strain ATCC 17061 / DSM 2064 / JCM 8514 / BCRC 14874 / CCUG 350202 / NBRC 14942 / NCIMB 11054 / UW101) TaxID=376686 RepID=A5FG73_FLAJ1|nr:M56 family metallopeptidase [Flavobacterium johnsoniae]ABQ05791.1 peptidase family M56, BlaR1 [Flavobacterium johnsoniae UW101]OXG01032.1 peptidase M56 [Flavobacterium johnsoniae UW101]WQG81526.1 M56 family metallopeptidase [Flavobacterium johnsoniae UW101]SHK56155.1 BlaR1 peptidase M56 [Flavobacterium johnsoniae]